MIDALHRKPQANDFRTGRNCQYCQRFDPQFSSRHAIDKLVHPSLEDRASAHLTEDGYVKHRIAELSERKNLSLPVLAKSA
jgi:hypothetical protein